MSDRNAFCSIRRESSRPRLAATVVSIACGICLLCAVPVVAGDGNEPGESINSVVVRAETFCPDPPAHLPATGFRLELSEFESPLDPMTAEILASKEIRVELTVRRDGFDGRGVESIALEPFRVEPATGLQREALASTPVMAVHDLQPAVVYFARALVLIGEDWVPTDTIRFMTPVCAVDGLEGEEVAP